LILLDTHTWLWWIGGSGDLSATAGREIGRAVERGEVHISSISSWEVSLLVRKGRLSLAMPVDVWIARTEALPFVHFVPLDNRIACRSNQLADELHDDPADRIIVATALTIGALLITKDARLRSYAAVKTAW
jgi:PIN domain nuclease of toxin-antitoxin system